ncbi:MAG: outer membrane protein assembly factor BamD [Methylotenera sp.]|nr:outer membrane protein assembly factor BamD [Oligoflexia bacterium]
MGISKFGQLGLALLLSVTAMTHFSGCSGKAVTDEDPAVLYQEAEDDIKSDHFQIALDKLRVIKNKHPYSKQAVDAQLRIADVFFMQESFAEAAASYEAFKDLHPKHERVSYAMNRQSLSYYNDIPGNRARDLTPAFKALDSYEDFVKRFPLTPEAAEARGKIVEIRKILADKELYIANFYLKQELLEAAKGRYEKILAVYPETTTATEAKDKLTKVQTQIDKAGAKKE